MQENFSNDDINYLVNLRSQRDEEYTKIFKNFTYSENINQLRQDLTRMIRDGSLTRKQRLSAIFDMAYQTEYANTKDAEQVRRLFDDDQGDETLMNILDSYNTHKSYLKLKNELAEYLQEALDTGKQAFKDIKSAISDFLAQGMLMHQDAELLYELHSQQNVHLQAAWEAYTLMLDQYDLADTLMVLCDIKRQKK